MKTLITKIIIKFSNFLFLVLRSNRFGMQVLEILLKNSWNSRTTLEHNGISFKFTTPNILNQFRAQTFASKEPETLDWIDSISDGTIFWDIGANVGLYSCYAAKVKNCQVYAFEPSVFNLELLARNVYLNDLVNRVSILPIALSESRNINQLNMTTTDWGGALSTFGKDYGHDGTDLVQVFNFRTLGLSMDEVVDLLAIPYPDHIKMDVDGIEQLILKGGKEVLSRITSISVEINEDFVEQFENSVKFLTEAGLKLKHKKHSAIFDDGPYQNTFNQVWIRA